MRKLFLISVLALSFVGCSSDSVSEEVIDTPIDEGCDCEKITLEVTRHPNSVDNNGNPIPNDTIKKTTNGFYKSNLMYQQMSVCDEITYIPSIITYQNPYLVKQNIDTYDCEGRWWN